MNAPRKVFVASSLSQDKINQTFKWPDGFVRTVDRDEAEFIVLDLANFPEKWLDLMGTKPPFSVSPLNLPVLFVALGQTAPEFEIIAKHYKPIEPPVYRTPEELFNAMQWFQSIFPFYNQAKIKNIDEATGRATLAARKAQNALGQDEDMLS
jgi:hypothetical protein